MKPIIVWFRQDLRLADNPALTAAAESGRPILCLYIREDGSETSRALGGASCWWLHGALQSLQRDLRARGGALILRRGSASEVLLELVEQIGADTVFWNRRYEPDAVVRDTALRAQLIDRGLAIESFKADLLAEPWELQTAAGRPYRVFTPFWRALRARDPGMPIPAPHRLEGIAREIASDRLEDWALRPTAPDWAAGLRETWRPGEHGAHLRLEDFLTRAESYPAGRDRPGMAATSRLSPHLHFGEISPRQVWRAALAHAPTLSDGGETFLRQLGWREFCHHLLFHNPTMAQAPLVPKFDTFPWRNDSARFAVWCHGRTGIPLVDAGMRELWQTGWMHNRVRMVAASFLVKHLMIDWRRGEAWFWDTLVDADPANNAAGWQWVAGCGADAAPFFRIFNPVLQGEKFDPQGDYVRRFVPELAGLPDRFLHKPWQAPAAVLARSDVQLGENYPFPIVDLAEGRARALAAFRGLGSA